MGIEPRRYVAADERADDGERAEHRQRKRELDRLEAALR
jgi:hypothetical protein